VLGYVADIAGYAMSYVASGVTAFFGLPFLALARGEKVNADRITNGDEATRGAGDGSTAMT
jgi:hypothetical protein